MPATCNAGSLYGRGRQSVVSTHDLAEFPSVKALVTSEETSGFKLEWEKAKQARLEKEVRDDRDREVVEAFTLALTARGIAPPPVPPVGGAIYRPLPPGAPLAPRAPRLPAHILGL